MRARIVWKTKEQGGRSNPPAGVGVPPYATVVRYTDNPDPWPPRIAWSLVVEKLETQGDEYHWVANVSYLMNDAPKSELRVGREFELYEGGKCVARGVLSDE